MSVFHLALRSQRQQIIETGELPAGAACWPTLSAAWAQSELLLAEPAGEKDVWMVDEAQTTSVPGAEHVQLACAAALHQIHLLTNEVPTS